jgi:hypothetical protein
VTFGWPGARRKRSSATTTLACRVDWVGVPGAANAAGTQRPAIHNCASAIPGGTISVPAKKDMNSSWVCRNAVAAV